MNRDLYSNTEFTEIRERINKEIQRRSTYKWWDPLTTPSVGIDKTSPLSLPDIGERIQVDENTYAINNPSEGSIECTRNIEYPAHGVNPAGQEPDKTKSIPSTSAASFNADEMRNFLVGLAKIKDINLFYGRDEVNHLAFRDPQGIEDVLVAAENSELNAPLKDSDISPIKNDPNGGVTDQMNANYPVQQSVIYPTDENGNYIMPSGEYDGEEMKEYEGLSSKNFYDDYGALPGDSNFHPYNRYTSEIVHRDWNDQGNDRKELPVRHIEGGITSVRFGTNPRNPEQGNQYTPRPVFGGKIGACNVACTSLCYMTCDNECSESCTTTCWNRCGNACTSTCGNVCTGCTTLCYTSCKTKCENSIGYSCLKAGAKTVMISSSGGKDGEPAQNHISHTTHTCDGCSFSCQFYPNKKTECWDSGCMGKCFTSCDSSCSTSCYGGCIDNTEKNTNASFKTGKGRGCSGGCTLNCVGLCSGVCEGYCVQTCFHTCKGSCSDNCTWVCSTNCGAGCEQGCINGCKNKSTSRDCTACGASVGGCTSTCQSDCNGNCIGIGCRSICGVDAAGACEANCRLNCMGTSCTAMCSDACSSQCTTCVNTCGFQCGACSSLCSVGCGEQCNVTCTENCSNSCSSNCVQSCISECGGCSNLCYSCVGMCIGICSIKCEAGCSSCANLCSWWCDSSCNRVCFGDCSNRCISTCSGSCATFLTSEANTTDGPDRDPTANGYIYPHPKNRLEERESFKLFRDVKPYQKPEVTRDIKMITIAIAKTKQFIILEMKRDSISDIVQQIIKITDTSIVTNREEIPLKDITDVWRYHNKEYHKIRSRDLFSQRLYKYEYVYIWDTNTLGNFNKDKVGGTYLERDSNVILLAPEGLKYDIKQTSINGGVYNVDQVTGEVTINTDMLPDIVSNNQPNPDKGGGLIVVILYKNDDIPFTYDDIDVIVPFEFQVLDLVKDKDGNTVVIIQRDLFLFPEEIQ